LNVEGCRFGLSPVAAGWRSQVASLDWASWQSCSLCHLDCTWPLRGYGGLGRHAGPAYICWYMQELGTLVYEVLY